MKGNSERFIPHRGYMKLIDEVESSSKDYCKSKSLIRSNMPTVNNKKAPAFLLIELMAQTIAAYNTMYYSKDQKVELGFLVGIRNFKGPKEFLEVGDNVTCEVRPALVMGSAGTFKCVARVGNDIFESTLTAYVPSEIELEKFINN